MGRGQGQAAGSIGIDATTIQSEADEAALKNRLDIASQAEIDRLLREGRPICAFCFHGASQVAFYYSTFDGEDERIPNTSSVCDRCASKDEMLRRSDSRFAYFDIKFEQISEAEIERRCEAAAAFYADRDREHPIDVDV